MIGNDVVDLELARTESNWKRKGFLQKLFTQSEQALILQHHDPEIMVWILWSMKEGAYKIHNRQTGLRAFIPHKLECSISINTESNILGRVVFATFECDTVTTIEDGIVNTIATTNGCSAAEIQLSDVNKDSSGLPYVVRSGKICSASVSHHGRAVKAVTLNKRPASF